MNEMSKQASPATYEIQEDGGGTKTTIKMEILDKKSTEIASIFSALNELLDIIQQTLKTRTPHLNGEKYLSNRDVCRMITLHLIPTFTRLAGYRQNSVHSD